MNWKHLTIILIVATVLRVALLAAAWNKPDQLMTADSGGYIELSQALANSDGFVRDGQVEIFRTPGYPVFLALGAPFGDWSIVAVAAMQIVLDVLLVYLTGLLGWVLIGPRGGLVAAGFQAVAVVAMASAVRVLSDGLFALTLTMTVLVLLHHFKTDSWWSLLVAGAVMGIACYIRPVALVMTPGAGLVLLLRRPWPKRVAQAAAFGGVVLVMISPWVVRNNVRADYLGFSSFASDSIFAFSAPKTLAEAEGISEDQARDQLRSQEQVEFGDSFPTAGEAARFRSRRARQVLLDHPLTYAKLHIKGTAGWFMPAATDVLEIVGLTEGSQGTLAVIQTDGVIAAVKHYFRQEPWAVFLAGPLALITLLRFVGLVGFLVKRTPLQVPSAGWLILVLVLAAMLLPGPANHPRFRVPVAPLLSVLAAAGWIWLVGLFGRRSKV